MPRPASPAEPSAILLVFQSSFSPPFRNQLVDQTAARSYVGKHPAHPFSRSTTPLGIGLFHIPSLARHIV
jgi:hypothetical protein